MLRTLQLDVYARIGFAKPLKRLAGALEPANAFSFIDHSLSPIGRFPGCSIDAQDGPLASALRQASPRYIEFGSILRYNDGNRSLDSIDHVEGHPSLRRRLPCVASAARRLA